MFDDMDQEPVEVTLVGGPSNGKLRIEQKPEGPDWLFGIGTFITHLGGDKRYISRSPQPNQTIQHPIGNYGSPERDGKRWVRRFRAAPPPD